MAPTDRGITGGLLVLFTGVALYSCSDERKQTDAMGITAGSEDTAVVPSGQRDGGGVQATPTSGVRTAGAGAIQTVGTGGATLGGSGKTAGRTAAGKGGAGGRGGSAGAKRATGGSTGATCDPKDKTAPPTTIQYSGKDSPLWENGATWYEPEAYTDVDTPCTGPYKVTIEVFPDFDQFTVYHPAVKDRRIPIVAFANGGCIADGTFTGEYLKEVASYGFLIIADGPPGGTGTSPSDGTQQKKILDWAISENERPCSIFYHKLDTSKIAIEGNSCGGLMTMYAAPDPRVTTALLTNSGLFARDQALYDSLHAPMAIFDGGDADPASANAQADVDAINNIPILFANNKRGHASYLWDDNGDESSKVAVAWYNWFLLGDKGPKGKGMFIGDNCGMCIKTDVWPTMNWKNLDLLKD